MLRPVRTTNVNDPYFRFLFDTSFPAEEKIPLRNLVRTFGRGGELCFYYDNREFVGFTFTFETEECVFLVYIATRPELRNRGYGTDLLEAVEDRFNDKDIFLVLEGIEGTPEEKALRSRRSKFYKRNGWKDTGIRLFSDGCYFDSMYYGSFIDADIMDATIRYYEDIHNGRI